MIGFYDYTVVVTYISLISSIMGMFFAIDGKLPLAVFCELPEVHYTVVRVAKDQMGIGGDDSWGARTHEEYLLETDKKMEFSFVFKGL